MVRSVSSRLVRLLDVLISGDEPVSVNALAQILGTSRRTIFRELERVDEVLSRYNLKMDSVSGKGLQLVCSAEEKQKLFQALHEQRTILPGNRKERHLCLLIALLSNSGVIQKLCFYADDLGVSESTLSSDLDELEPFLAEHAIMLIRKSGQGVYAVGAEENIRRAMITALLRDGESSKDAYSQNFGYPPEYIEYGVRELFKQFKMKLDWMTNESAEMFCVFLMIMVERVEKGLFITEHDFLTTAVDDPLPEKADGFQWDLADFLVDGIEHYFTVSLPQAERRDIAMQISACRAKQYSPVEIESPENREFVASLTFQMIEAFDPHLAPVLKTNERLVEGLQRHMYPALSRLKGKVALQDPFKGALDRQYPELYVKTMGAVKALEKILNVPVPQSELSFIAIHFYAAFFALGEKNIRKRTLRAGVVCVAGVGISYMVASQIRKRYAGELEITICGWNDYEAWEKTDFLVSTLPLDIQNKAVLYVHTILDDTDHQNIRNMINTLAFVEKTSAGTVTRLSLGQRINTAIPILEQTNKLITGFTVLTIADSCTFEELVWFCAEYAGKTAENVQNIQQKLVEREAMSSQVITDMNIVLLHTRCMDVSDPLFVIVKPESNVFSGAYFHGAKSCVLMLLPSQCPYEMTQIMGNISAALVETPAFLDAVYSGNALLIRTILEAELSDSVAQYCIEKIKQ
ncbi:MAG: PRD domain-containing protein [Treponema sp.]|jgi:transcriptional antiterminator/mannitol/fructose-specific phosphotransferase system IIA component (Ntr-type)|nr:PRD domain-containing protein [Treponema sp.]